MLLHLTKWVAYQLVWGVGGALFLAAATLDPATLDYRQELLVPACAVLLAVRAAYDASRLLTARKLAEFADSLEPAC